MNILGKLMDYLGAVKLELTIQNSIIDAVSQLLEELSQKYIYLNPNEVKQYIRENSPEEFSPYIDQILYSTLDATPKPNFGGAPEETACQHPLGCNSRKLTPDFESFLLRFKIQRLLDLFTLEEDHLLPRSCGGDDDSENIMWWCKVHNRHKSDELAWYLSARR